MVGGRLLQLAAAAVTTLILDPSAFGLLAVATAAWMVVDRLTFFGLESALVQRQEITPQMMDVAWSYQLARNLILMVAVMLAAPWLAALFKQPAATNLIRVLAIAFAIAAFRNIGLVWLRRELDFRTLAITDTAPLVVQAVAAVALTYYLRTIYGIVYAVILAEVARTVVSYAFRPHLPRLVFTWKIAAPMFGFGLCLLGNTLLQTAREQGVVFVLARMVSEEELGYFNRATAFSFMLFVQALMVFWRVTYPAFSKLQSNPTLLTTAWRKANLIMVPGGCLIGLTFALVTPWVVRTVLGDVWEPIVPVMQVFGLCAALMFASAPSEVVFQAIARPILGTKLQLAGTLVLLVGLVPLVQKLGITGAAWAFVAGQAVVLVAAFPTARQALQARQDVKPGPVSLT